VRGSQLHSRAIGCLSGLYGIDDAKGCFRQLAFVGDMTFAVGYNKHRAGQR